MKFNVIEISINFDHFLVEYRTINFQYFTGFCLIRLGGSFHILELRDRTSTRQRSQKFCIGEWAKSYEKTLSSALIHTVNGGLHSRFSRFDYNSALTQASQDIFLKYAVKKCWYLVSYQFFLHLYKSLSYFVNFVLFLAISPPKMIKINCNFHILLDCKKFKFNENFKISTIVVLSIENVKIYNSAES